MATKKTQRLSASGNPLETILSEAAQNSVELSQNAKGELTFSCKLYSEDQDTPASLEQCFLLLRRFHQLRDELYAERGAPSGKVVLTPVGK